MTNKNVTSNDTNVQGHILEKVSIDVVGIEEYKQLLKQATHHLSQFQQDIKALNELDLILKINA